MTLADNHPHTRAALSFPEWPQFDERELQGLERALRSGAWWRVAGCEVVAFEEEFAAFHRAVGALAVTNGTHALELALRAGGVGPGDEVVVPALTYISTSLAVQNVGATPVVADIDHSTYCLDPNETERLLSERTAAIVPVHMAGHVADMDRLTELSDRHAVPIVQDAAHAHGARWRGRDLGELGTVATFSFQNGKLITAGEGGALIFPTVQAREDAFLRHNCGRPVDDRVYRHEVAGSNFRMNEFSAAVLRVQLSRLQGQLSLREQRWREFTERLAAELPGVVPQGKDARCTRHSRYMAMVLLDRDVYPDVDRDELVDRLTAAGIPAFVNYPPVYRTRAHWMGPTEPGGADELATRCPNAETIGARGLWFHHRTLLGSSEDVAGMVALLVEALRDLGRA